MHQLSLLSLLMAIGIGAIVGLVNEYRKITGAKIFMGLRTSIFTSMFGYVIVVLYEYLNSSLIIVTGFLAITVVAASIYIERARATKILGATTYVSMFLVFVDGVLVGLGDYLIATAISVIVATLSFYKTQLLSAIKKIRREELLALLDLLVISLVILPLLPNRYIGPMGFFNPYQFWLVVVVVSLIFFGEYITLRASKRGLLAFSIIGGLVSSTTVTLSLIDLTNRSRGYGRSLALNTLISNIPLALIQVLAAVYFTTYSFPLTAMVAVPALALTMVLVVLAVVTWRELSPTGLETPTSPLPFRKIIEFALLLFVIIAAARVVVRVAPNLLLLTTVFSALANVLGIAVAIGELYVKGLIGLHTAVELLTISLATGVAEKALLALLARDRVYVLLVAMGSVALAALTMAVALAL